MSSNKRQFDRLVERAARLEEENRRVRQLNDELERRIEAQARELENSRQRAQVLFEFAPAACIAWGPDYKVVEWNRMAEQIFGWCRAEVVGRSFFDFIVPEDEIPAVRSIALEVMEQTVPNHLINRNLTKDGRRITCEWYNAVVPDPDGRTRRVMSMCSDVSVRERADAEIRALNHSLEQRVAERTRVLRSTEDALREVLTLNENILKTSNVGIAAYHRDGRCVQVNPVMAQLTGGSIDQLLAQNFRELASWRKTDLLDVAERVLVTGEPVEHEAHSVSSFGVDVWVNCQLSRFTNRGEAHLLLIMQDITEKRRAVEALSERERALRTLADNVPDNIIRFDLAARVVYANRSMERTLGCSAAELLGTTPTEGSPDGRYDTLTQAVQQVAMTGENVEIELSVPDASGQLRYHAVRIVAERGCDGSPVSVLAVGHDLTAHREAVEALQLAASVFHNSAEGVLVTDAVGRIVSVNPAFTAITGYSAAEALGQRPSLLRSEHQPPEFYDAMWQTLARAGIWQGEIWNRRKNGEAFLEWLTINRIDDHAGNPVRYVGVFHDITEMRRKDEHIQYLAFHDVLTGLPNRALINDRLLHALDRAQREDTRLAVMFIDLDGFKRVNDNQGHQIGDLLLQMVATRIKGRLRSADTVARMGGDEFLILMEKLGSVEDCARLAADIVAEIAHPMDLNGHSASVGASVGIACYPEDGRTPGDLIKGADTAMYAAKAAGRGTYRFFGREN